MKKNFFKTILLSALIALTGASFAQTFVSDASWGCTTSATLINGIPVLSGLAAAESVEPSSVNQYKVKDMRWTSMPGPMASSPVATRIWGANNYTLQFTTGNSPHPFLPAIFFQKSFTLGLKTSEFHTISVMTGPYNQFKVWVNDTLLGSPGNNSLGQIHDAHNTFVICIPSELLRWNASNKVTVEVDVNDNRAGFIQGNPANWVNQPILPQTVEPTVMMASRIEINRADLANVLDHDPLGKSSGYVPLTNPYTQPANDLGTGDKISWYPHSIVAARFFIDDYLATGANDYGTTPTYTVPGTWSAGGHTIMQNTWEDMLQYGCYTVGNDVAVTKEACSYSLYFTGVSRVLCSSANDGHCTVNITNPSGLYTYVWSDGGTGATRTNLGAGTTTVTVTSVNTGCSVTASLTLTRPPLLSATTALCINGTAGSEAVNVSGGLAPYQYSWTDNSTNPTIISGASYVHSLAGTTSIDVLPQTYASNTIWSVRVTDANGCIANSSQRSYELDMNAIGSATIVNSPTGCSAAGSIQLDVSSVKPQSILNNYTWSDAANNPTTSTNYSNLFAGVYIVTVSYGTGCSASDTFTLFDPDAPFVDIYDSTQYVHIGRGPNGCNGDIKVNPQGNGPFVYSWINTIGGTPYTLRYNSNGEEVPCIDATSGNYIVKIIKGNCIFVLSIPMSSDPNNFSSCTGICNYHKTNQTTSSVELTSSAADLIELLPNPALNNVEISYALTEELKNAQIQVYDVLGKMMSNIAVSDTKGSKQLNLSAYATGTYTVVLVNGGHKVFTKRLVKE